MRTTRFVVEIQHESYPKSLVLLLELMARSLSASRRGGGTATVEMVAHTGKCKRPECGCIMRDNKHETIEVSDGIPARA